MGADDAAPNDKAGMTPKVEVPPHAHSPPAAAPDVAAGAPKLPPTGAAGVTPKVEVTPNVEVEDAPPEGVAAALGCGVLGVGFEIWGVG